MERSQKERLNKILFLFLVFLSSTVSAVDFTEREPNVYEMRGKFNEYTWFEFDRFIGSHQGHSVTVVPYSPGGNAIDLVEIMTMIHDYGMLQVEIEGESFCYSACAIAFSAAYKINGIMAFHPIAAQDRRTGRYIINSYVISKNKEVLERFIEYGMEPSIANKAMKRLTRHFVYIKFSGTISKGTIVDKVRNKNVR